MNADAIRLHLRNQSTEFSDGFLRAFGAQAIISFPHRTALATNAT